MNSLKQLWIFFSVSIVFVISFVYAFVPRVSISGSVNVQPAFAWDWVDEFESMNPRWEWDYQAGTGYHFPATIDGYSVAEAGITDGSTSLSYSDCSLHSFVSLSDTDTVIAEMRLRCTDDNGITVPGQGSRGWGFWDGTEWGNNIAWFWSASPESDPMFTGFLAGVRRDGVFYLLQQISIDMREWHTYRIEILSSGTKFLVDRVEVAFTSYKPRNLNKLDLWIDNYRIYFVNGELRKEYLNVGQNEKMYIDWVKMFVQ